MIIEFEEPMVSISKSQLDKRIAEENSKVAREIFEEIEKKIVADRLCSCEVIMTIDIDTERYAELKKKYMGERHEKE